MVLDEHALWGSPLVGHLPEKALFSFNTCLTPEGEGTTAEGHIQMQEKGFTNTLALACLQFQRSGL